MASNSNDVSPPMGQLAKRIHLDIDDAFSSGEDEPNALDLKAAVAASRRQLEEHEQTVSMDGHQQADDVPPSAVTPAWSIHAYTGASTSTIDLALEPNARSPFAQDTFNIDEDVPYTRRSYAPEGTSPTSPAAENTPPHEPVQDAPAEEIGAMSLQEVPLRDTTHIQGGALASDDRTASQGPLPALNGQASTSSRPPVEIRVPTWPSPEAPKSPTSAFDETFKKQMRKSTGPSVLQKVISKTRPTHLPPKPHEEDAKHQKDWEEMMRLSREAEGKRKGALEERRLERERAVEESIPIWERDVVPDWRNVLREPRLRKLWWKGIPTKLRGQMWELAVGNALQLSKDTYKACAARAHRAMGRGTFPRDALENIEEDIKTTLPSLHLFHVETGPIYQDLKDLLTAWTVARSDEGLPYVIGASRIGAMLLINMGVPQAFIAMRNLLDRHCLRSFYGGPSAKEDVEAYYRIFDTLLADCMPKVYFNFKQHQIPPSLFLTSWFLPIFIDHLPFEACARLWDVILLEGDSFLFRAALGILDVLESRLLFPDRKELLEVLNGESKVAMQVAKRIAPGGIVELGARYEIYGMNEEVLWERIMASEEWWKSSTWTRLIQRELPDV